MRDSCVARRADNKGKRRECVWADNPMRDRRTLACFASICAVSRRIWRLLCAMCNNHSSLHKPPAPSALYVEIMSLLQASRK